MLNLGQYLYQLLLLHPQVGVPGIGVFSKSRIAARYDEQLEKFLPPASSYSLVPQAVTDSHLVDCVAKSLHLSNEEALAAISEAISHLQTAIKEQGEAKLQPIGTLKETAGIYTLVAEADPSFWGLQPIGDYKKTTVSEELPIISEAEEARPDEVNAPILEQEAPFEAEAEEVPSQAASSKRTWLWGLTAVVFIGLIGFLVWKRQNAVIPNDPVQTAITPVDTTDHASGDGQQPSAIVPDTATTVHPADSVADTLRQAPAPEKEPLVRKASKERPFSIVIGSFKTLRLAIEQAKYFRTIGINAFVLESNMPNNRKKICYGSYATKEAAKEELEKVRNEITKEAYIYP
ncbi:hypothetical protein [Olivibacter sp. XZL3]|uniref:HU domain-containing protein n=1 Tax=Olivibacter sp. XZL3 TaxID=1735116 RepID=UPI001065F972|nr:hypothetical protein [Olivibacter sp. XZL3]